MKRNILLIFIFPFGFAQAQKIDSIYVNLYTDSLKKGTYNYINIDGRLAEGRYLPLDSTHIIFTASAGKFTGNNLWIAKDFSEKKVSIKAVLKSDTTQYKLFDIYIKQKLDDEKLKTTEEIINEIKQQRKNKRRSS